MDARTSHGEGAFSVCTLYPYHSISISPHLHTYKSTLTRTCHGILFPYQHMSTSTCTGRVMWAFSGRWVEVEHKRAI